MWKYVPLFINIYCFFSLISPPFNKINDYLFTSTSPSSPSIVNKETKERDVTVLNKLTKTSSKRGMDLYLYLHVNGDIRTPKRGEVLGSYKVTSPWGWRVLKGESNFHSGVDLATPENTPLLNPFDIDGKVIVNTSNMRFAGLRCDLDINGIIISYLHMNNCDEGKVGPRGKVGLSGGVPGNPNAGRSTGAHAHISVKVEGKSIPASRFVMEKVTNEE